MVKYKQGQYRSFVGTHLAVISEVLLEPNKYYDPDKENSTEENLTIVFGIDDPQTLETSFLTQKFIAPLTGGNNLFQQLLDAFGEMPDAEGGQFDEDKLVGLELVITVEKDKKGKYDRVVSAMSKEKAKQLEAEAGSKA